jgi:hypothetical protein
LQESLRRGVTQAAVLNSFRYGTLVLASDRLHADTGARGQNQAQDPSSLEAYFPKFASRFVASGTTTMLIELDATGKALQASVTGRRITVQGIRGQRPIAFENIFDRAAVNYILQARHFDKPSQAGPARLQIVWTLDDDAAPSNSPKKGGQ